MKMLGKYKAIVGNTKHPEGLMMCQIKLVTLWDGMPEEELPWAEYQLPIGAAFVPAKTGDFVWVEFPLDGDSRHPLITGAAMVAPSGNPNVPPESSGKGTAYKHADVDGAPALPVLTPGDDGVSRRNGLMEVRTKSGAIMFTHEKSGSRFGMNDDGDLFFYAAKNLHFFSGGTITMTSTGDFTQKTAKYALTASGAYTVKAGNYTVTASAVSFKKG
jgi:hypothetical protein